MNSGKFPSASDVLKEVGGSYYTMRKIVQELQYESKMSSTSWRNGSLLGKEVKKEVEPSNDVVKVSSCHMAEGEEIGEDAQVERLLGNAESRNYYTLTSAEQLPNNQQKIRVHIKDNVQKRNEVQSKKGAKESELAGVDEISTGQRTLDSQLHEDAAPAMSSGMTESAENDKLSTQIGSLTGSQMADAEVDRDTQTPSELENITRDLSKKQMDDAEHQKKSSTWEHLKSLADGIISIWRKL